MSQLISMQKILVTHRSCFSPAIQTQCSKLNKPLTAQVNTANSQSGCDCGVFIIQLRVFITGLRPVYYLPYIAGFVSLDHRLPAPLVILE